MLSLLKLPQDLILEIIGIVAFTSFAPLMRTSKKVYELVKAHERSLCKSIYIAHLDAPTHGLDWVQEVKNLALVLTFCTDIDIAKRIEVMDRVVAAEERRAVGDSILKIAKNATPAPGFTPFSSSPTHLPSRNILFLARLFEDNIARDLYLYVSSIFQMPAGPHAPGLTFWDSEDLTIAQLHCLYGRVNTSSSNPSYPIRKCHAWAELKVYNLCECTHQGNWGPFRDDLGGQVDWPRIEAAMMVLANNVAGRSWDNTGFMTRAPPFSGSYPHSFSSPGPRRDPGHDIDTDPYGITGTWTRVMSILDPMHFNIYNQDPDDTMPWGSIRRHFKQQKTEHVTMSLRATGIVSGTGTEGLPIAHFEGFARKVPGYSSERLFEISGTCRMTIDGEVRWKVLCTYSGQPKWRVDAVQIGGMRSGRGAIGMWFPADYSEDGPVGPVAFWKKSDKTLIDPKPKDSA